MRTEINLCREKNWNLTISSETLHFGMELRIHEEGVLRLCGQNGVSLSPGTGNPCPGENQKDVTALVAG